MKAITNKVKQWLIELLQRQRNKVRFLAIGVNLLVLLALSYWVMGKRIEVFGVYFDQVSIFVSLTIFFVILNQLYRWLLSESEYSPAYALATGYVSNFLVPTITQLLEDGDDSPVIYVYKIKSINELYKDNVDRVEASICNRQFDVQQIHLKPKNARARDLMSIQKSKTEKVYFDFPNTLTSLTAYIDYKTGSKHDETNELRKDKIAERLIEKFYQKAEELVSKNNITENIRFCDQKLEFVFK